jgi:hypothetical protein
VLFGVPTFLTEEAFDLRAQGRIVDLVHVVVNGADKEALSGWEEHADAVDEVGGQDVATEPVAGNGAAQVELR